MVMLSIQNAILNITNYLSIISNIMPKDRYLPNSTTNMNYPNYLMNSLAYLQLRKPAFLCGETRSLEYEQLKKSLLTQESNFQKNFLTESTRFRLKRIQKNPFLKSHNIYPKINCYSQLQEPQKIPVSQKQKYILYHLDLVSKNQQNININPQRNNQKTHENIASSIQTHHIKQTVSGSNVQKDYIERQKPVKDQPKSANRHFAAQRSQEYNIYSRYRPQSTYKLDKQYDSQFNQKYHQYKDYTPSQLQHRKAASDNQTIIHRLEENTNQFSQELYRVASNQRTQQNGQKTTATFEKIQPNYSSILGVIKAINDQGQMGRQKQNGKRNFPQQIVLGKMTYYSLKIQ